MSPEAVRTGVLYDPHDYLPFWKRLIVSLVDALVVIVAGFVLAILFAASVNATDDQLGVIFLSVFAAVSFVYLVVLKRSTLRTVAYRLFGARIVSLSGTQPSIWQMTQRLAFGLAGPANYFFDFVWITQEETRQSLRDKWAGTYVVRVGALPRSHGRIVTRLHDFMGASVLFDEVVDQE